MEKGRAHSQPAKHSHRVPRPAPMPAVKRRRQPVTIAYLMKLLEARPWAFWGGMWASLFLVMMVSLSSLLSPGSPGRSASGAAFGSASLKTAPDVPQQNRVPGWLFGAIAITCTAGSMLVSKQLSRTSVPVGVRPPRAAAPDLRSQARVKRLQPYSPLEAPLPLRRPLPAAVPVQPNSATAPQPFVPPTNRPLPPRIYPPTQVAVTVVPDAENHPLDWGTASLADSLDLRKQRSLASWIDRPHPDPNGS